MYGRWIVILLIPVSVFIESRTSNVVREVNMLTVSDSWKGLTGMPWFKGQLIVCVRTATGYQSFSLGHSAVHNGISGMSLTRSVDGTY